MDNQSDYICIATAVKNWKFYKNLINKFGKKGKKLSIVPANRAVLRAYQGSIEKPHIIDGHLSHNPNSNFRDLTEKYSIRSPERFVFPEMVYERAYPSNSYNRYISPHYGKPNFAPFNKKLHRTLDYFDELYSEGFDAIHVTHQGARIVRQVIQSVADYHNVRSIRYSFSPLSGRKSVRSCNEMQFPRLKKSLEEPLTEEEQNRAEAYVESVRKNKVRITHNSGDTTSYSRKYKNFRKKLKAYRGDLPEMVGWKIMRPVLKSIGEKAQSYWHKKERNIDSDIASSDYIFYPLQYSIESRITLRAPAFYDQSYLVKYLARNLPTSSDQLLVKDHPHHIGHLSLRSAYEISQNSLFVDPYFSTHKIIKNSEAVITLNNTVGHEALIWQKPVITLGDALYNDVGLTYDVEDINEVANAISEAVEHGGPTETELLRYIDGLFKISDELIWGDSSDDNIEKVIESLIQQS